MSDTKGPPYEDLRYCMRCCMPETSEGTIFDEMGMCRACASSEQKMHINWEEREKELQKILEEQKKANPGGYDCLVPISGGKTAPFRCMCWWRSTA